MILCIYYFLNNNAYLFIYVYISVKCINVFEFFSYLHSCSPPIIHGNLTCDTIFIQHNGLVKIGSGK